MRKISITFDRTWRPLLGYIGATTAVVALLWFKLGTLLPNFSQPEIDARISANSIQHILKNPFFAPYKVMQYITLKLGFSNPLAMRSISAFLGLLIIIGFYRILRVWYSNRMAILGAILFATSAWFLHYARLATPDIMYAGAIGLLWCGLRLRSNQQRLSTIFICTLVTISLIYVPGIIWIILFSIIWQYKTILREINLIPRWASILLIIIVVGALEPLVAAIVQQPDLLKTLFGLPNNLPDLRNVGINLLRVPIQLFWHSPANPVFWLDHLPLLDIFSIIMFALGIYAGALRMSLDRTRMIVLFLVAGTIMAALGGMVHLVILMPFIYLVVVSGVTLMLQQWLTVFPRNPVAGSVGASIITIAVLVTAFYNFNHYFIAWPNTPETKIAFNKHP